jgi:hypothetical protein
MSDQVKIPPFYDKDRLLDHPDIQQLVKALEAGNYDAKPDNELYNGCHGIVNIIPIIEKVWKKVLT